MVLPQPVRASGGGRGPPMGAGVGGGGIRVGSSSPALHTPHRPRSVPRRPQVRRRLALRSSLESASHRAGFADAAVPVAVRDITVPVRRDGEQPVLEVTGELRRYFTLRRDRPIALFPDAGGLAFVRPRPDAAFPIDGLPVLDLTALRGRPFSASSVRLVVPRADLVALVSYLQRLGTSRGVWRDVFAPQMATTTDVAIATDAAAQERGRAV